MAGGEAQVKNSDLGVRTLSAIVMVAAAGTALWLGGWVWTVFVIAVALGVLWEWWGLARSFNHRVIWTLSGVAYVAIAAGTLLQMRLEKGIVPVLLVTSAVIATDIGAYFAGRTIGGPKIAPSISPSKTWAGLAGGMVGASLVYAGWIVPGWCMCGDSPIPLPVLAILMGMLTAVVAQAGDFFESWMKRKAGVKDSGALIPGHGGVFDRVDGLLAVCFVLAILFAWQTIIFLPDGI